jgi:hypothetical protein
MTDNHGLRVPDGALLKTYDQETGTGVPSVQFSPDGTLFACGRDDATVVVARSSFAPWPGDLDGDRDVDLADLALLLGCYGRNEAAATSTATETPTWPPWPGCWPRSASRAREATVAGAEGCSMG